MLINLVQTQGTDTGKTKKIGDYTIPEDSLKDNFCSSIDQTKFHDVGKVDDIYTGFVDEKLNQLKAPVRAYLEKKEYVRFANFHF